MKKIDVKSLAAGFIIGTLGVTTVFAAAGIKSAVLNSTKVTLNGTSLPLSKSLISVTMDDEQAPSLYAPVNELLEQLGYTVHYDSVNDTVNLISGDNSARETVSGNISDGNVVMSLANHTNQKNIAESGSFRAEDQQTLILDVISDIKGGSVDLFLFDPNGKEQRITIGSSGLTKEIALTKGIWKYNCSGVFKDGGNIRIVGTIK